MKTIDLEKQSVKDLMGIAFFSELEELNCSNNSLTELNVGGLTNLKVLKCSKNKLTELNVSGCQALERLDCDWNKLTKLNITGLSNLDHLNCSTNELTELSVSGCSKLTRLDAHYNRLKILDLSASAKLTYVDVSENRLTSLNLTKNTALQHLECSDNKLSSLDLTKNTKLTYLRLNQNSLTELDLHANKDLKNLDVYYCQLTELDLSANTKLAYLNCRMNDLAKVDISNCGMLLEVVEEGSFQEYKNELRDYDLYAIVDSNCSVLASIEADVTTAVYKPIVLVHPEDQTVKAGAKANFTVQAKGGGLSYQWQYSTDKGATWKNVTAASGKTAEYTLTTAARHDGYRYMCKITNAFSGTAATYSNTVTLQLIPTITTQPKTVTAEIGKKVTFTVTAAGSDLVYQWYYSADGGETWKKPTAASAKTSAYSLTVAAKHTGYKYKCVVKNDLGKVTSKVVTLKVKPKITKQPAGTTVKSGKKATFTVKATNATKYQWYYRTSKTGSWKIVSGAAAKKATYTFTAKKTKNGYQYRCKVSNATSYVYTNAVTLKVK